MKGTGNIGRVLLCTAFLVFCTFHFSLLTSSAQGLPLIRNYAAAEYGGHNRNFDIEIGDDGTIFVANFEGVLYYDRARWRIIRAPEKNRVTALHRDSRNTIWAGGYNFMARLQKEPNGELSIQRVSQEGLFEGEVQEIFEDGGALYFVVSDGSLYQVSNDKASLKGHKNVAQKDTTQTLTLEGRLQVIVKRNDGLLITDSLGRELFTITEANGLCSNQVSHVAYDRHGVLWGATAHGVFAVELPSVYSYILPKDGLTGEVQAIAAFNGNMYIGDTNGVMEVASHQCRRIADINNICWELCPSPAGLLAATSSGIYRIAANGSASRLTSNATTALLVDGDKVYAGEPDGVYAYQLGHAQGEKINDLPLVTDIRKDTHGKLWLKNVNGRTVGNEPTKEKDPVSSLPRHLVMPIKNLKITTQYQHGSQVWVGGDEILTVIDTAQEDLAKLSCSQTIRFCSIVLGNDSVLWGGFGEMPETLRELDSDERHLHFHYALNYAPLTGRPLYRYRLNNSSWSEWSRKQSVEFLNHPYGSYTLYVQALLANGELSEVVSVHFDIAYPLPMRWYMVVLYILCLACLFYLLFHYRLKKLEKDKAKLERIVDERTADLRNAQQELIRQERMASVGKLTKGLVDRILNPMNYIINFSKMSIDLLKDLKGNIENNKDKIGEDDYLDAEDVLGMLTGNLENVDKFGQDATHMLKAMEEILKYRSSDYSDMDLLPVLQQSEQMLRKYFAKEIEQYGIQASFDLPDGAMPIHGNPDMLKKTVMSLLGNAIYAVAKKAQRVTYHPEVLLSATLADGRYILRIRDNGIGIEEQIIGKIFDPFFTTKTTSEGAGIGLYLSREIIQNHGGDISVASVKNEFTEFTVTLPL